MDLSFLRPSPSGKVGTGNRNLHCDGLLPIHTDQKEDTPYGTCDIRLPPEPEPLRRRLHPSLSVSPPVSSPFLHTVIEALLEQLALLPAEERADVLELSCGEGHLTRALAATFHPRSSAVTRASLSLREPSLPRNASHWASCICQTTPSGSPRSLMASPIWSQACLDARHTDTLIALMGSAIRVLRPGGIPALCRAASGAA